jgi:hypothetical protein
MDNPLTALDCSQRDQGIIINSYTTVLRHAQVPYELFSNYWRDVHGPLCSRMPGLGWYVQYHFAREQDAHLWPKTEGIAALPGYTLDGAVEIGFGSTDDQQRFKAASKVLFADEQNMFEETLCYNLPTGSTTFVDYLANPNPNETDPLDRLHVHFHGQPGDEPGFMTFFTEQLAPALAADPLVLKLRLHLPTPYDNARPAPPSPNVRHEAPAARLHLAMLELVFESALARRQFYGSHTFRQATVGLSEHVRYVTPFAVRGVFTYVRDGEMTLAGLRGSRAAQLIRQLGATNQIAAESKAFFAPPPKYPGFNGR